MASKNRDPLLKHLIEANVKTQESVSTVVASVKELVSALKDAGEEPEESFKTAQDNSLSAVSAKLDKLLKQNEQLLSMFSELARRQQEYKRL